MNGIEMMLVNILQNFGIDPEELMKKANSLIHNVETKLNSFDERLANIEKALDLKQENTPLIQDKDQVND